MSKHIPLNRQHDDNLLTGPFPHPGHPLTLAHERDGDHEHEATLPAPLWIDVREAAAEWTGLTAEILSLANSTTLACGFQGLGQGLLALSYEESAYAHYHLVANRLRQPPGTVVEGLEQTLKDLHEAYTQWVSVGYWLERVANAVPPASQRLEPIRDRVHTAWAHQQRLYSLLLHGQQDAAQVQRRLDQWNQRVRQMSCAETTAQQRQEGQA